MYCIFFFSSPISILRYNTLDRSPRSPRSVSHPCCSPRCSASCSLQSSIETSIVPPAPPPISLSGHLKVRSFPFLLFSFFFTNVLHFFLFFTDLDPTLPSIVLLALPCILAAPLAALPPVSYRPDPKVRLSLADLRPRPRPSTAPPTITASSRPHHRPSPASLLDRSLDWAACTAVNLALRQGTFVSLSFVFIFLLT